MGSWERTAQTFPRERGEREREREKNRKMENGEEMGRRRR